jgi:hypothetical protein
MVRIRDATESDLNECGNLSQIEELKTPEGDYPNYRYLKEFLDKGLFLVAEDNKKIIGYYCRRNIKWKCSILKLFGYKSNSKRKRCWK